ncbi:hypothetical protein S245_000007 [Arachis hypogaea]|nr:LOB domain-containing protein [Arachis hypogaea]
MSSTNSPCAACKFLRRKCTQECIFAPYFPPDNPQRFASVHRVFGASNIGKILNDLSPCQREDAVTSLAFEAEARLDSPVYGCVRHIVILQQRLHQIQMDLLHAKSELSAYINPQGIQGPFSPHGIRGLPLYPQGKPPSSSAALFGPPYGPNVIQSLMPPSSVQHNGTMNANADLDPEQRELLEAQQLAAQQHDMMVRNYEQQQQQQEYLRYNAATGIIEPVAAASPVSVVTADGDGRGNGVFAQMAAHSGGQGGELTPCLGLGTFDSGGTYHHQLQQEPPQHGGVGENYVGLANRHHYPVEAQFLLPSQQQQSESEDFVAFAYNNKQAREQEVVEEAGGYWKVATDVEMYYNNHFLMQHDLLRELANHQSNQEPIERRKRLAIDLTQNGKNCPNWLVGQNQPGIVSRTLSFLSVRGTQQQQKQEQVTARIMFVSTDETFTPDWYNMNHDETEVLILNIHSNKYTFPDFIQKMRKLKVLIVTNQGFHPCELNNFEVLGSLPCLKTIRLEKVSIPSLCKFNKLSLF